MAKQRTFTRTAKDPVMASLKKAFALHSSGKIEKAQRIYKSVLKKQPRNADANHLLGVTCRQLDDPKRAIEYIEKAIQISPNKAAFYTNLARAQKDLPGIAPEDILANTEKALSLDPRQLEAINLKALQLLHLARKEEAERIFEQLFAHHPDFQEGRLNYAKYLLDDGRFTESLEIYSKFLLTEPEDDQSCMGRISCLLALDELDTCELELANAHERFPGHSELKLKMAQFKHTTHRYHEGLPYAQDAVRDAPQNVQRRVALGVLELALGQSEKAVETFETAKNLYSGRDSNVFANIDWNLFHAYKSVGNLEKAWDLQTVRFHDSHLEMVKSPHFNVPTWQGEDISSKTIMVWVDQGIGDAISSGVMLHDLKADAGKIIYEGPQKTLDVFRRAFPDIECRLETEPNDDANYATPSPDYDCEICITDLVRHYRRDLQAFAKAKQPAYQFDQTQAQGFIERLGHRANGPIVGVSWRSRKLSNDRINIYLSAPDFAPIMELDGVTYVNLQYVSIEKELLYLKHHTKGNFIDFPEVNLFDDIDSAMSLSAICDIVIAANTSASVLPAVLDIPVLSWGSNYLMPLSEGKYSPVHPATYYYQLDDRQPTTQVIPHLKAELDKFLENFSPENRNKRLGI